MLAILLVLASGGFGNEIRQFDLMELNHCQTADGLMRFDQIILWDWSPDYRRWHVQYWIMASDRSCHPVRVGNRYECHWTNGANRIVFSAKLFRETWTIGDPERENIRLFPVDMRRKLVCER